jgi:hypothetical protein
MPQTYEPITQQTISGTPSTITISSIPSTYTDLVLVCWGWGNTGGGSLTIRGNGDGSTLYNTTYLYSDGSTVTSGQTGDSANGTYMGRIVQSSTEIGGGYIHIFDYANTTTFKTMIGTNFGSNPINWASVGMYRSTNAISSLTLKVESGSDFATGFTVALYGIKAA